MAIIITPEDIKKANSYIEITKKEALARLMANICIEEVKTKNGTPPMYRENRMRRSQFMMGVLASLYFNKPVDVQKAEVKNKKGKKDIQDVPCLMGFDMYDEWAGSHVINQMERLKHCKVGLGTPKGASKTVGDKVFDILYDYKGFETMLCAAIKDKLCELNDFCDRFTLMMQQSTDPETVKAIIEELNKLPAEVSTNAE